MSAVARPSVLPENRLDRAVHYAVSVAVSRNTSRDPFYSLIALSIQIVLFALCSLLSVVCLVRPALQTSERVSFNVESNKNFPTAAADCLVALT
jgi:hypothetical protein